MKYITKEVRIGIAGIIALCVLVYGINYLKGINMFKHSSYFYVKFKNVNDWLNRVLFLQMDVRVGIVRDIYYDYNQAENVVDRSRTGYLELRIPKGSSAGVDIRN